MKRHGILNPALSRALARMGHTDAIVICDAGLPIPDGPERIDLSLLPGVPSFQDVLAAIMAELQIERAQIATEFAEHSRKVHDETISRMDAHTEVQGAPIVIERISHEDLKHATRNARAVVRTGECTPFANVILYSGVPF